MLDTINNILDLLLTIGFKISGFILVCYIFLPSSIIDKVNKH